MRDTAAEIDSPTVDEIDRLLAEHPEGVLMRRDDVIDHLLDLRAVASEETALAAIDRSLGHVPGRSVVEVGWWSAELVDLRGRIAGVG